MHLPRLAAVGAVLLVTCLACGGIAERLVTEPVPPPSDAWVGVWEGPGMTLVIDAAGRVQIEERGGSTQTSIAAPATAWRDDGFVVGVAGIGTTYEVDQPPWEHDGKRWLIVEGTKLLRVADVPTADRAAPPDDVEAAEAAVREAERRLEEARARLRAAEAAQAGEVVPAPGQAPPDLATPEADDAP